jgi:hypothetical protein
LSGQRSRKRIISVRQKGEKDLRSTMKFEEFRTKIKEEY